MRPGRWLRPLVMVVALLAPLVVAAQTLPTGLTVEPSATGLAFPVAFDFLPGTSERVLFAEQFTGLVRLLRVGAGVQAAPVLTVPGVVAGGERGLLGLAVDPGFPANPYLYVFHDAPSPNHIRIARYTLAGDLAGGSGADLTANPATRFDLLDAIPDVAGNHNGGTLRFGGDGTLYASLGEDAVPCAAQDSNTYRGKILRMRTQTLPDGPGTATLADLTPDDNPFAASPDPARRLIYANGLRNPFRMQFDPIADLLVIADVGETQREELDLLEAVQPRPGGPRLPPLGAAVRGSNFGWPFREGTLSRGNAVGCGPEPVGLVAPVFDYDRSAQEFGAATIAVGLYWPPPVPLEGAPRAPIDSGDLLVSDYYSGAVRRLQFTGQGWQLADPELGQPSPDHWAEGFTSVSDWRVRLDGSIWYCRQSAGLAGGAGTGSIGRIVAVPPPPLPESFSLRLESAPAIGHATFVCEVTQRPLRVSILDASGRKLRVLPDGAFRRAPDGLRATWDGTDEDGRAVPPGLYLARFEAGGREGTLRVPFLR